MSQQQKNELINHALDVACAEIQLALGVQGSTMPELFFSADVYGEQIKRVLSIYIDSELTYKSLVTE